MNSQGHGQSYAMMPGMAEHSALRERVVVELAARHSVTPAQVVLRWGLQRGCAVIPKSENEKRIRENIDLARFVLSDSDMAALSELDKNFRFNDPGKFCPMAFNTSCPIWD